jgi:hypothetical protein
LFLFLFDLIKKQYNNSSSNSNNINSNSNNSNTKQTNKQTNKKINKQANKQDKTMPLYSIISTRAHIAFSMSCARVLCRAASFALLECHSTFLVFDTGG